jgi:hypothetical protein
MATPYFFATRSCLPSLSYIVILYSIGVGIVCGVIGALIVIAYRLLMKRMSQNTSYHEVLIF